MNKNMKRKTRIKYLSVKAETGKPPQFIPYPKGHKAKVAAKKG